MAEYDGDLLQLLAEIIKNFHSDAEAQSEVISTIACLADIGKITPSFVFNHNTYKLQKINSLGKCIKYVYMYYVVTNKFLTF